MNVLRKVIDFCIAPDKLNKWILNVLAVVLTIGCIFIIIKTICCYDGESLCTEIANNLFPFLSLILLMAATVHLSTSLLSSGKPLILKKELLSAILMSAFSITLVAIHKGIEMFMNDHGDYQYGTSEALLIIFILSGGVFMVATIWITRNIKGINE